MPTVTTVMRWLQKDEAFREQYRESREIQAEILFDQLADIADAATPEDVNVAKLRIWTRQWIASRLNAKKYGDKPSEVTVNSTVNNFVVMNQDQMKKLQERNQAALMR